ncbi:hypothetical protein AJ87_48340 [Rhizobium yanglingense]|nr:hypothetical protein AJ87_48340 [Rhizobium yanglingense]
MTAIETIPDGFAFFDADDRLVLVNQRYLQLFPETADLMTPGRAFEDIVRAQAERGTTDIGSGSIESWVAEAMQRHRQPQGISSGNSPMEHGCALPSERRRRAAPWPSTRIFRI